MCKFLVAKEAVKEVYGGASEISFVNASIDISAVREEASIFQMLDHGNIVEMYGVIVGNEPALVLELCRG